MNKYDIAIIGGGAAGMMAAIFAAYSGKNVVLIERNDSIGKKLLATGNGRCNLTNINADSTHYHGGNPKFIDTVLHNFGVKKTIIFFESIGLMLKEEAHGRIFPRTNLAKSVLDALQNELARNNAKIILGSLVRNIKKSNLFETKLENGKSIISEKLILTTGGKAAHQFGSSGDGYFWAKQFGHNIVPTYPALVPIEIKESWVKQAQGIKIEGTLTTKIGNSVIGKYFGDILFTHFGLSGPAAMSGGRSISSSIQNKPKIYIDLFPDLEINMLDKKLRLIIIQNGKKTIKNCLSGIVPQKLGNIIIENLKINPDKKSAEISKIDRFKITQILKNIELTPVKTRPFKEAQVTAGGIDAREINPETMESNKTPGLYFAGEIIDVDGDSGGYNLEWAWSSGFSAGQSAGK